MVFLKKLINLRINKLTPYQGIKSILFLGSTVIVIVAAYNLLLQFISWKWSAKFFASLLVIIGGLSAYFVNSLGVIITPDQIQNLLQTDLREAKDLWSIRLIIWTLIFVIFPLGIVTVLKIQQEPLPKQVLKKAFTSSVSLIAIATLLFCFYVDYAAIFREHRDLKSMISPQNTIASTLSYYKKKKT